MHSCRHLILGILFASTTVACGARTSQWVQVVDCKQRHVVVPNAAVYVYEGSKDIAAVGVRAQGGRTDQQGNTWASFPAEHSSYVKGSLTGKPSQEEQPTTDVPANPTEYIYTCVNR
jgi:hypothetical protein